MYYLSNISNTDSQNWIFTASTKVCTIRNFTTIASQSKNHKAFQNWYQLSSAHTMFEFQGRAHSVRPVHISSLISRFEVVESDLTAHAPPFLFFSKRFQKNSCPTFFYVVWHWPFRRAVVCRVYLENKYNYILKVVATFRVGLSRIKYCVELLYLYKVTTARWAASEFSLLIVTNLISQRPMTN